MTLTDTQLVLLSAASQREHGGIELAPNLKGGAVHRVVGKLLSEGLIEEIPATGDGIIIEFRSVVAVRCAIEVQNGMVEEHAGQQQAG